jgi:hypothetical protein
MPRSRSRERRKERSRSRGKRDRSRERSRRDRSQSRDKHHKKDKYESSSRRHSDNRKYQDRDRKKYKEYSRDRDRSRSRSHRRHRSSSNEKKHSASSKSQEVKPIIIKAESSNSKSQRIREYKEEMLNNAMDLRDSFEIANEFSREGFEEFSREHGIDFTNIETDDDRITVHEKMEELLKAHFAAQGKIYPPPKPEKPPLNSAGFANDGSFLEQFKKMQDDYKQKQAEEQKRKEAEDRLKNLPLRRRGGKILKTGIVAKNKIKVDDRSEAQKVGDPWSLYIKEVQKYKSVTCDSDTKTRPLVK